MNMESEKADLLQTAFDIIAKGNIVLCPSWGEYPVYDDLAYDMMCYDLDRMNAYKQAIQKNAKDKTIVEIGTGSRAPLALMCAEAGAKLVYAIEADPDAAQQAEQLIKSKNLEHKIKVIHGYSTEIELPERVDLCVSEIIGNIGSSEGAISILNSGVKHFLKDDASLIPERCVTQIAPVFLPDNLYESDLVNEVLQNYVNQIYQAVGYEFPITRYAVYNFPESNIIVAPEIFEDIHFNHNPGPEDNKDVEFHIPNDCRFDGFLLWVCLYVDEDNIINTFRNISWAPIYLKAKKMDLKKDDVLKVDCIRKLSQNQINPDYFFDCRVVRDGQKIESFRIDSYYTKA
jgi:predicted RNA methylase